MISRRDLLKRSLCLSLAPWIPPILARTAWAAGAEADRRKLVVIQLDGGNDGLNTLVPFADERYRQLRPTLKLAPERLIKLSDSLALHSSLRPLTKLVEDNRLMAVQGVGYPNPNHSHFESMAIWHSARLEAAEHGQYGWLGRGLDAMAEVKNAPQAVFAGSGSTPVALWGRRCSCASVRGLDELALDVPAEQLTSAVSSPAGDQLVQMVAAASRDAIATSQRLAGLMDRDQRNSDTESRLAGHMKTIGGMIKAGTAARVFYAVQSGYDTHAVQLITHAQLLGELARSLAALTDDLKSAGMADQVLIMVFSEFGRRATENASDGTDHGAAAPVFLAGPKLASPMFGPNPDLGDLDQGDVRMSIDFRQVYATLLDRWLDVRPATVLSGEHEQLAIVPS